ncbi:MAG: GNAT family N-acetyltransferase [Bifidobacteriaceae bacterium]|jgi:GNAT superfamily N-acetyltransferase|nr:GNAT family N-acetyltransferase [Bifidobacteriaceae bacterium]
MPRPQTIEVREARPEEHSAVGDVLDRAYSTSYDIDEAYRDDLHHLERFVPRAEIWVALADGAIAGALIAPSPGEPQHYVVDPPAPELGFRLLGVDPAQRGRGVGRALVGHVIALARERGLARVGMYSAAHMIPAHRLYEQTGFTREPWRDHAIPGHDVPLYAFALDVAP